MISAGGRNLHINKSNSPMSAQSSATGRLPGAPNIQSTAGTGTTQNWAQNFRQQQTGLPAQTPFMPDTTGGAQLPNGPQTGGFLSMFNFSQGGGLPVPGSPPPSNQPPVDNSSNPFQPSGDYMGALNDLTSTPIGPPPSTPERDAARAQQQAEQQQIEADRYLKQAFEFFNNPTWDKMEGGLSAFSDPRNRGWGWEDATASYAGNPYITDAQRKQVYTDYRNERAAAERARQDQIAFLAG